MNQATFEALCPRLVKQIPTGAATVIEAHAGTGKTFTIEHLVIDLLLRPELSDLTLEQILVVTFTDKATVELKTRIREKLEFLVSLSSSQTIPDGEATWTIGREERQRLQQALFSFDLASIFTIHGFCSRILSDQAFDGNRLFRSELGESRERFAEAFHRTLRETPRLPAFLLPLLATYLSRHSPDDLGAFLWALYASGARFPAPDLAPEVPFAAAPETLLRTLCDGRQALPSPIDWSKLRRSRPQAKTIDKLNRWLETVLQGLSEAAAQGNLEPLYTDDFTDAIGGLRADAGNVIPVETTYQAVQNWLYAFPDLPALLAGQLFPLVQAHLERDKRSHGWYDFDDLLLNTWRALTVSDDRSGFRHQIQNRFRVALIDEFQDTDPVQWNIFRRLFFESDQHHTLVLIGDPKQAIYGFRGADVETYLRARDEVRDRGGRVLHL
ncbi:MAG TPA: UvrD-helicase domain-containing protein, partial [Candidatus Ozemobacteraceae bacterium]|nr:UvrD-helicase domain-containing protein [Candidatus Ozemobacteraceae bacterium]